MSKFLTPKDLLDSQVKEFNRGNIDFLMTLYEMDACFASKPDKLLMIWIVFAGLYKISFTWELN